MGEELESVLGADVELTASSGGVFEIVVDNQLIFSKKELQRFPEEGEIILLLQASGR